MKKPRIQTTVALPMLPPLPGWIMSGPAETFEAAAFRSGAALAHLTLVTAVADLPHSLWRDRLALAAAEVCVGHSGRREGAGALRDAVHLTKAGDDPGPAGRVFRQWSKAVARPILVSNLCRALEGVVPERIALCLDTTGPSPVDHAARVIEAVLADSPRGETTALILADALLAKSLGWTHMLPLLALGLKPRDLRRRGGDLRLACHQAVAGGARQAVPMAGDLMCAAVRLRVVIPKLRAKTAGRAVDLFLSCDALAPSALNFMSDRAARRLCERLVDLGALRELTGRNAFRLYGV